MAMDLTPEAFGKLVGLSGEEVRACELGSDIPRNVGPLIDWQLELHRRQAAATEAGHPDCPWIAEWEGREPAAEDDGAFEAWAEESERHESQCPACRARNAYIDQRFGSMPAPPAPGWVRFLRPVFALAESLPAAVRPALWGALVLLVLVGGKMLIATPVLVAKRAPIGMLLGILGAAAAAGAAGGLAYGLLGRPLRRLPMVGPYLAGIVAVGGYLGAFVVAAPVVLGEPLIKEASPYIWIGAAIFFGAIFGHSALRTAKPRR